MRPPTAGGDLRTQRALAARLDRAVGRLAEDREVGGEPVRVLALDAAEPVALGLDLLAVVEHERQVVARLGEGRGQVGDDGVAGLHVRRAAPVEQVSPSRRLGRLSAIGTVSMWPASSTRRSRPRSRASQHGVARAQHLQRRGLRPQRRLQGIGQRRLLPRDAGHVDEGGAEVDGVRGEVEFGGHPADATCRRPGSRGALAAPLLCAHRRNAAGPPRLCAHRRATQAAHGATGIADIARPLTRVGSAREHRDRPPSGSICIRTTLRSNSPDRTSR